MALADAPSRRARGRRRLSAGGRPVGSGPSGGGAAGVPDEPPADGAQEHGSAAIFLLLRRLRAPLITLVLVFAVSVLGLTLVPGQDADGEPVRTSFFDAFYFMSYTATTIGFGELPHAFTDAQRLWVVICIYLTVVAWAYAIGSLLSLLQDRAFRSALALQHFQRKVARLREPFLIVAGYGQTGELLVRAFDELGRRLVVLDIDQDRIDALDLASYHGDVPGLAADVRSPAPLQLAGLRHPQCEGVVALTDDDEANLAVAMTVALLRPELPVVARTISAPVAQRMRAFGTPTVVNPFDRFGEHLLMAVRSPASYRLLTWLQAGPGAELPPERRAPAPGRWIVCGYGRFGRALTKDLRAAGQQVTVVEQSDSSLDAQREGLPVVVGDGTEAGVLERAEPEVAVGLVAGTDNDTTNLSLVAAARRRNPDLFRIARQNSPADALLFSAMGLDAVLVPPELVAHETYAHLSTPMLWRFLQEMPAEGDAWAERVLELLVDRCGEDLPPLWKVRLTDREAPALQPWLRRGGVRLGELLRHPDDRDSQLEVVVLLALSGDDSVLLPGPDHVLRPGDQLLLAGRAATQRSLGMTLIVDAIAEYALTGVRRPESWVWRALSRSPAPEQAVPDRS